MTGPLLQLPEPADQDQRVPLAGRAAGPRSAVLAARLGQLTAGLRDRTAAGLRDGTAAGLRDLPALGLPVAVGLLASAAVVLLSGRAGTGPLVFVPHWGGLWEPARSPWERSLMASATAVAIAVLVAAWWQLSARLAAQPRVRAAVVAAVAALWTLPLLLSPPLLSLDAYAYIAQGGMLHAGLDPYTAGPSALGGGPLLTAVDPLWQQTPSPYGPVTLLLLWFTSDGTGSHLVASVLLVRALAVLAVAGAVAAAVALAPPGRRAVVLGLCALNPVVLLHLVGGAHLDALLGALAIGTVWLMHRRRPGLAMTLAVLALLVKLPGAALVGYVLFRLWRYPPAGLRRGRALAGVLAIGLTTFGAVSALVPDPFGWIGGLTTPTKVRAWYAPSSLVAGALQWFAGLVGLPVSDSGSLLVGRISVMVVGGLIALVLLLRAASAATVTAGLRDVGWALLVIALAGPVLYPWYLTWGLFAAAVGSGRTGRRALLLLSAFLSFSSLPDMSAAPGVVIVLATLITVGVLVASRRAVLPGALGDPVAVAGEPAAVGGNPARLAGEPAGVAGGPAARPPSASVRG